MEAEEVQSPANMKTPVSWCLGGVRRVDLLIIGSYILLSLVLTWPLAGHFATHVPGDGGDDPALAWNLWWVKWALVDQGTNPFDCRYLFHPLGINLAFYTLTVLNGCLSIPLQGLFGLVTVSNLILLSSFVIGAYGTYLLTLDLLRRRSPSAPPADRHGLMAAAAFAGLVYGFSSSKTFYASLGQFNIASNQWVPFYALMLTRMGREPRRRRYAVLAGVFLLLQGWAEMTYASFLLVFTALYLFVVLWQSWRKDVPLSLIGRGDGGEGAISRSFVIGLLVLGVIFLAGMLPILSQMWPDMQDEGDFFMEGSGFAGEFSCDLLGFLVPTQLHPWFGHWVSKLSFPHDKAQHYFLGYTVMALGLLGLWAGRRRGDIHFWAICAGVFFILTLGPTLRVNGHEVGVPLPFRLFQMLPFFKGNRYPSRYGVMLVLSVAILAGLGLAWAWNRLARRRKAWRPAVGLAAALGFLIGQLSIPLPLSDLRVPPAYAAIAEEAGDYAILDLPVAWRNGFRITGIMHPIFMYAQFYQTAHHKRLLGGNTSRNPEVKFQYFTEAPVLNSIIALEGGHPVSEATWAEDRQLAPAVLRFFGIRYVVLHRETAGAELLRYVESVLPVVLAYEDADDRVYAVRESNAGENLLRTSPLDSPLGRLALGEGWGMPANGAVWAQAKRARLLAPAAVGAQTLSLELRAPAEQRVSIRVNHCDMGNFAIGPAWTALQLAVPAACVNSTMNDIWLRPEIAFPAHAARAAEDAYHIGQTGTISPVEITVYSAGKEVGDFGHIYINGEEHSPNGRGYNLVALEPRSGIVLGADRFDTHLDPQASSRLADFVNSLPPGTIVALAAMDEASLNLSEEAVDALRSLGLAGDLRGHFRWSHAGVGVKGAKPGQALEAWSGIRPATVIVGNGLTRQHVYVQLRSFSLSPAE